MNTTVRDQIKEVQELVKKQPEEFPRETRGSWLLQQQLAKRKLPELQKELFKSLEDDLFMVYVIGNENPELNASFASELTKAKKSIVVTDIYAELARLVMPALGAGGEFNNSAWQRFLQLAGDYSDYYSAYPTTNPQLPFGKSAQNVVELRALIKELIDTNWSPQLNKMFVYEQLFNWSMKIEDDFDYGFVIMYLDTEQDKDRNTMFNKKPSYTVSFESKDTDNKEIVSKILEKANKHYKKGK